MTKNSRIKIVIIDASFGGLELAKAILKKSVGKSLDYLKKLGLKIFPNLSAGSLSFLKAFIKSSTSYFSYDKTLCLIFIPASLIEGVSIK